MSSWWDFTIRLDQIFIFCWPGIAPLVLESGRGEGAFSLTRALRNVRCRVRSRAGSFSHFIQQYEAVSKKNSYSQILLGIRNALEFCQKLLLDMSVEYDVNPPVISIKYSTFECSLITVKTCEVIPLYRSTMHPHGWVVIFSIYHITLPRFGVNQKYTQWDNCNKTFTVSV